MSVDWNAVKREVDVLAGKEAGLENDRLRLTEVDAKLTARERDVKVREEALTARTTALDSEYVEKEADLSRREQGIKSIRNELSLRNARVKTLEDEVKKADAKVAKAREEKGTANAESSVLRKRVAELEQALSAQVFEPVPETITKQVQEGAPPVEMVR